MIKVASKVEVTKRYHVQVGYVGQVMKMDGEFAHVSFGGSKFWTRIEVSALTAR